MNAWIGTREDVPELRCHRCGAEPTEVVELELGGIPAQVMRCRCGGERTSDE